MNTNVKTKTKFSKFQTKTINSLRTIFSYPSVVTVDIDCFLIGFIYRFIQFFILTYLIGLECWAYEKNKIKLISLFYKV